MFGSILSSVAGNVVGGLLGKDGAEDQNHANAKQAQLNRDFQERMSNTSYQRGMKDMKKAGLNPMLAFMKGGASTPSGAQAEMVNEMAPLAEGVKQTPAVAAQINNLNASSAKAEAEAALAKAQAKETEARTPTHASTISVNEQQIEKMKEEVYEIASRTDLNRTQAAKLSAEINNVVKHGRLLDAQSEQALSHAGLTTAQIKEVVPRINKMVAETLYTSAGTDFQRFKSDIGNLVHAKDTGVILDDFASWLGNSAGAVRTWFDSDSSRRNRRNSTSFNFK